MMLSSLLDSLNKRIKQGKPLANATSTEAAVQEFLRLIGEAEKFDFGLLPAEYLEEMNFDDYGQSGAKLPMFKLPDVTEDEHQFWFDGLIPLPAPVCWYEMRVSSVKGYDGISGVLIKKDNSGRVWVQRIESASIHDPGSYMIDGTWVLQTIEKQIIVRNADKHRMQAIGKIRADQQAALFGSTPSLVMYLTLMLNSKSTEIRHVVPTRQQQLLRSQLNKTALPAHTIVTIVPKRFIDEAREADGVKGTHASPRLHWRRSHTRTIHRGLPSERVIVIARQIIGRREIGEVKHDYVVRLKT